MSGIQLDMVLHPPTRLQIASVLSKVSEAEFARLKQVTGAADSVLSKHLSALAEAGYATLRKAPREGRQRTWVSLTSAGRAAFAGHLVALQRIARGLP